MGKAWARGDFCTLAPDKLFGYDLSGCCYAHDVHYMNKDVTRLEADIQLRENIVAVSNKLIGWIYYIGVRLFGWIYY